MIYCSQASTDFSQRDLVGMLRQARANNEADGVSGMLLHCNGSFLQLLEGDSEVLGVTYARISDDERHESLRLLFDAAVAERLFPDWTMGFEHLDDTDLADELDGFAPETAYPLVNPDLVTSAVVAQRLLVLYAGDRGAA